MFCKYCGSPVSGTRCSKCGKETVLFAHSTELENLLEHTPAPNRETYNDGFSTGYRKGLAEGYRNGKSEAVTPEIPENEPPKKGKGVSIKLLAVLCGLALAAGAASAGFIAYGNGYRKGADEGETKAASINAEFDARYEEAREAGRREGEKAARQDYDRKLAQLMETPTHSPEPVPAPPAEDQKPAPDSIILFSRNENVVSEEVRRIQKRLHELGFLKGKEEKACDGRFGKATEAAVKSFQKENGIIPAAGQVDQQTYNALFPELSETSVMKQEDKEEKRDKQDPDAERETAKPAGGTPDKQSGEDQPQGPDQVLAEEAADPMQEQDKETKPKDTDPVKEPEDKEPEQKTDDGNPAQYADGQAGGKALFSEGRLKKLTKK